ncbi:hypothetical protein BU16DRAFT_268773 [Lophium mytilinum]|uniref:Uncharacterized protein n=1 Tax=Lophium mytilinum TaxID=390894 RepID=A0A6A6R4R3_9PEZI|nr:hypothetical protein BU16DRAFT_268773 [Lophium mytilinum]
MEKLVDEVFKNRDKCTRIITSYVCGCKPVVSLVRCQMYLNWRDGIDEDRASFLHISTCGDDVSIWREAEERRDGSEDYPPDTCAHPLPCPCNGMTPGSNCEGSAKRFQESANKETGDIKEQKQREKAEKEAAARK